MIKSIMRTVLVATLIAFIGLMGDLAFDLKFAVQDAEARFGRPLTPISYAGVARRTTRRAIFATSVYVDTLPGSCQTVIVEGTSLYLCGSTYYQSSAGRYVVVNVN
ncbi:MAG: hypothetical protein PVG16_00785 [Chromatiales bacterium]|jgi:hypothetical protein